MPDQISSEANHQIKRLKLLLGKRAARYDEGVVVVESAKVIQDLLRTQPESIQDIFYTEPIPSGFADFQNQGIHYINVEPTLLKTLSTVKTPQGVLAIVKMPTWTPSVLTSVNRLLILDQVSDPSNLGAVVRTALAMGWEALCLTPGSTDPYHPEAIRASSGACFQLPVGPLSDQNFSDLIQRGMTIVVLDAHANKDISTLSLSKPLALVLGSEGHGIRSPFILQQTTQVETVKIPISPAVESLNLAVSAGIACFFIGRT